MVSLAGGMPNIADLPLDVVGSTLHHLVLADGQRAMQYGSGQGEPAIREAICEVMKLEGISAHPDDVTVTVGSQQGLDLVTRIFCDPGDVVLCEAPSYVGALGVFRAYQCEVVHVAMDEQGLVPVALAEAIAALPSRPARRSSSSTRSPTSTTRPASPSRWSGGPRSSGSPSRPTCWWSRTTRTGCSASTATRCRRCARWTTSTWSTWARSPRPSRPGFRVGWVLAPHAVREKLVLAQESATLCPPVFSQFAVAAYLANHDWRGQIKIFREMYRERRDAMIAGLADHMPAGTSWTVPSRRLLRLGHPAAGPRLARHAAARGHRPGRVRARAPPSTPTVSAVGTCGCRTASQPHERIIEGTRRLGEVLEYEAGVLADLRRGAVQPTAVRRSGRTRRRAPTRHDDHEPASDPIT